MVCFIYQSNFRLQSVMAESLKRAIIGFRRQNKMKLFIVDSHASSDCEGYRKQKIRYKNEQQ